MGGQLMRTIGSWQLDCVIVHKVGALLSLFRCLAHGSCLNNTVVHGMHAAAEWACKTKHHRIPQVQSCCYTGGTSCNQLDRTAHIIDEYHT